MLALNLHGSGLNGALSPAIGNLTFLQMLNLSANGLHGEIPASLGRLQRLKTLDLSNNLFSGTFPANLSSCISMIVMVLDSNKLGGLDARSAASTSYVLIFIDKIAGIWQMGTRHMDDALRSFDGVLAEKPNNLVALLAKVGNDCVHLGMLY